MGTVRSPNDRVVRTCAIVAPHRPLLQQAHGPMQVGCDDRDTHGAFEAFPAMRVHPVQAMTFQRMDRRIPRPAVCTVEESDTFLG